MSKLTQEKIHECMLYLKFEDFICYVDEENFYFTSKFYDNFNVAMEFVIAHPVDLVRKCSTGQDRWDMILAFSVIPREENAKRKDFHRPSITDWAALLATLKTLLDGNPKFQLIEKTIVDGF
jgi:hypothetical protein